MSQNDYKPELEYELLFSLKDQVLLFNRMAYGRYTGELREWLEQKIAILVDELPEDY